MKTLPLILCCVGLSSAAGFVTNRAFALDTPSVAPAETGPVDGLVERLDTLLARQEGLERELAGLRDRPITPQRRVAADEIDAAIARWMAAQEQGELALAETTEIEPEEQAATLLRRLDDPNLDTGDLQQLWIDLRAAGLADEALALLEERAEAAPNDVDAQLELGMAYIFQLDEIGAGPQAGMVASQADAAFDRALELDDQHWGARFMKATSLSHWPPFLGKQAEAITNFEILIDQQNAGPARPEHADTYLYLGNLYKEAGRFDEAKATWQTGATLFPEHADLGQQLVAAD